VSVATTFMVYADLGHPGVLHLGGNVWCSEPLRLHYRAQPRWHGLVMIMGLFGLIIASLVNIFLKPSNFGLRSIPTDEAPG
jgi:hypothetical protein